MAISELKIEGSNMKKLLLILLMAVLMSGFIFAQDTGEDGADTQEFALAAALSGIDADIRAVKPDSVSSGVSFDAERSVVITKKLTERAMETRMKTDRLLFSVEDGVLRLTDPKRFYSEALTLRGA
jgi:hypothetical protein